jgi:hypothetical protein
MDPVTALGAAGSVIGIAGFGIQLSQAPYQFATQVGSGAPRPCGPPWMASKR